MKSAEEWLNENGYNNTGFWIKSQVYDVTEQLLAVHNQEITAKIDKMIEEAKARSIEYLKMGLIIAGNMYEFKVKALTEFKQWLGGKIE